MKPADRARLMEACMDGINKEVDKIAQRINRIEAILDDWERNREPMIFTDNDMALMSTMQSDADFMSNRVEELKKEKELLDNEMPNLRD